TMRQIGERLADEARLWGLFGCDFIVEGDTPWLTEVNPRYTAAMELLDHQWGLSLIDWHCQACASNDPDISNSKSEIPNLNSEISNLKFQISDLRSQIPDRQTDRCFGKIILFADRDLIAGDARHLLRPPCDDGLPNVADLPPPGQHISAGQPVCSLFASDDTEAGCRARLLEFALTFRERFTRSS
ncbi:MAG TPA: hypothetical protein VL475_07240, partial [Planctomycetaceae bacterium]|nr:hypothetical protein [Planctomycetaceae bacterium]